MPAVPPPTDARRCTATRIDGEPCTAHAVNGKTFCYGHDPQRITDAERCTAHITGGTTQQHRAGERCRNKAIPGGSVCGVHGGSTRHVKRAAEKRVAIQKVRVLVETYGLPVEIAPDQAILDEVHRTAGHVAWLEQQIRALAPEALIWGVTRVKEGGDDRGTTEEAATHGMLKLYQQERAHLVKVCAEALRAGIEERRVKLAERDGALVAQAIRAILADLQLTAAQQALVSTVVPARLRALAMTN